MTNIVWSALLSALVMVESGGNNFKVGNEGKTLGPLQIRKEVVRDVNRYYGTDFKHEDAFDPAKARNIVRKYLQVQMNSGKLPEKATHEDLARFYNGGSLGYKKKYITDNYWRKVDRELKRLTVLPERK